MHRTEKYAIFVVKIALWSARLLALIVVFQTNAFASELRSGIECGTTRTIHYRVSGGYGAIDDMIIGTEAELSENCITMPRGLTADMMPSHPSYDRHKSAMSGRPIWPYGIVPFVIDVQTLSSDQQQSVQDAINYFNLYTALRWVLRTTENDFVNFRGIISPSDSNFCGRSRVGRTGGYQHIELNPTFGCSGVGVVLHEMLHALGMYHEHQRADRGAYVNVTSPCSGDSQYEVFTTVPFGEYDLASIMHYGRSACMVPASQGIVIPPDSLAIPIRRCESGYNVFNSRVTDIGQLCALSDGDHAALDYFYPPAPLTVDQLMSTIQILQKNVDDSAVTLNIDDSVASPYDAATDGVLILRHMFGFSGTSLISNALSATAMRKEPQAIAANIKDLGDRLDVDNDGRVNALTDGLLIIRYMVGLRGQALIAGAIGSGANPGTAAAVESAIKALMPS